MNSFNRTVRLYVSVPARYCYNDDRYKQVKRDLKQLEGELDSFGDFSIVWFDSNKHGWSKIWDNTVREADIVLHYLQPGDSQHIGKGGYDLLLRSNCPNYIMYKPQSISGDVIRFYTMDADRTTKNEGDWQRYVEIEFLQSFSMTKWCERLKTILGITSPTFDTDRLTKQTKSLAKKKSFVDSLMEIDIYA